MKICIKETYLSCFLGVMVGRVGVELKIKKLGGMKYISTPPIRAQKEVGASFSRRPGEGIVEKHMCHFYYT